MVLMMMTIVDVFEIPNPFQSIILYEHVLLFYAYEICCIEVVVV